MKKILTIIGIVLVILTSTVQVASAKKTEVLPDLNTVIHDNLTRVDHSKPAMNEGLVLVSYTVKTDGTILINQINASSEDLRDYVVKKLSSIKLTKNDVHIGQTMNLKVIFRVV